MVEKLIPFIREKTTVEYMKLKPAKEPTTPMNSKLGGVPYMPLEAEYPYDRTEGREAVPLRFLAQINFGEMPEMEGFPREGILQFFVGDDSSYGMNYEDMTEQKGFRVLYHEKVSDAPPLQDSLPDRPETEEEPSFPFSEELRLYFEKEEMAMGGGDFRFDTLLLAAYNEMHPDLPMKTLERVPEKVMDELYDRLDCSGHHLGGYPAFTQLDPREYSENLRAYSMLLLQLDSEENDDYAICWGDSGICHFFIRPEDLKNRDFSNVAYSWDCY